MSEYRTLWKEPFSCDRQWIWSGSGSVSSGSTSLPFWALAVPDHSTTTYKLCPAFVLFVIVAVLVAWLNRSLDSHSINGVDVGNCSARCIRCVLHIRVMHVCKYV